MRRARPLLGTLVEVALRPGVDAAPERAAAIIGAAFACIEDVEQALSRFRAASDIGRFNAARRSEVVPLGAHARRVLRRAQAFHRASDGLFDATTGSGPDGWRLEGAGIAKVRDGVRLDLGGIAKGHAVDCAVRAMRRAGSRGGCVNAGGDLRVFGDASTWLAVRDESAGGVRAFGRLSRGAFATSLRGDRHVSVAAPTCLVADALTKVIAASGDPQHPLLGRFGACAWVH